MPRAAPQRTVLIVDDDPATRELLVDLLGAEGIGCRTVSNGVEALQACEVAPPELVLLDIRMPGMDGVEVCRRLKANPAWAEIPVIALTAADEPETVVHMMEAGSLLYVTKPFAADRLLATVRLALERPAS